MPFMGGVVLRRSRCREVPPAKCCGRRLLVLGPLVETPRTESIGDGLPSPRRSALQRIHDSCYPFPRLPFGHGGRGGLPRRKLGTGGSAPLGACTGVTQLRPPLCGPITSSRSLPLPRRSARRGRSGHAVGRASSAQARVAPLRYRIVRRPKDSDARRPPGPACPLLAAR